jgi:hypothetical protein
MNMTNLTIQIENNSILDSSKRILSAIEGVTIVSQSEQKCGLDEAIDDVKNGRVTEYENVDEMFRKLGI